MIVLYYSPGACSLASHIALAEAGADFEARRVDFASAEQRKPEYLALNPKGRVPLLVADRGRLTESPAILAWIAMAYPDARLAPTDPWDLAQMHSFNAFVCATLHVNHAHGRRAERWADTDAGREDLKAKAPGNVADNYAFIESELLAGPWVMGEAFSVADAYLYTVSRWMGANGIDPVRFPRLREHQQRMQDRPAVQAVLEAEGLQPV